MLPQEDNIATERWVLPQTDLYQPRAGSRWQGGRWLWRVVARSLLDALEQAEVSPSRVQTCTIEVWPKGSLFWGPGLLKAIPLASIGHLGAGRSSSPKDFEMFSEPRHCAANAVPLSQAGREGGEERGDSQGCPQHRAWRVWGVAGAQKKEPVGLKQGQPAGPARMGLDQDELTWGCLNL